MEWSTACPDWESRIVNRQSLVPCPPLFPAEASAALDVFKRLRMVDVPGSPTMGEVCEPWVFDWVGAIFGSYDAERGRRLINDFFLLISKKNGKSTIAAGIMVTALIRNWRRSAEYIILAPTIEVANNSAKPAMDMVRADPDLEAILKPIAHQRTIEHRTTGATLKIVAADSDVVSGKKASGILIDELWQFGSKHNAENMIREAVGGMASRPEGFRIAISTHADAPPAGVFRSELMRFRAIRDGTVKAPRSMGVLYEYPAAMLAAKAYEKPENWYVTNPNLGVSVDEQFLADQWEKDKLSGPQSLAGFFAKHLNVEIGLALSSDRWAGAEYWQDSAVQGLTLQTLLARCDVAVCGVDGGGLDDLLALAVLGRERDTRRWLLWGMAWAHRSVLERRKDIAPRLWDFVKLGELRIVAKLPDDVEELADLIAEVDAAGLLASVGLDPYGIGSIVDALAERGIAGDRVVGVSQGWKISGAIKTAERKLADGTLVHAGQEITAWAVSNAKVEPRGNAVTITKQAAGSAKIDPLMAALDAVARMETNPEPLGSVYNLLAAETQAQPTDEHAPIDYEVLRDPRHPLFETMKRRWEAQHLAEEDA